MSFSRSCCSPSRAAEGIQDSRQHLTSWIRWGLRPAIVCGCFSNCPIFGICRSPRRARHDRDRVARPSWWLKLERSASGLWWRVGYFPSACFGTPSTLCGLASLPSFTASTPQEMTSHHTRRKIESQRLSLRFCCVRVGKYCPIESFL